MLVLTVAFTILQQIEQLEKSQTSYEDKISQLRQHKEDCEKLLQTHNQECSKTFSPQASSATASPSQSIHASSSPASSPASTTASHPSVQPSANRRKQTTPRLNLDVGSCSDLHRRTSSSSSGDLHSPTIVL